MSDYIGTFGTLCPICGESIEAEGLVSEVIHEAKQEHLDEEHDTDELLSYYLANRIVEMDR